MERKLLVKKNTLRSSDSLFLNFSMEVAKMLSWRRYYVSKGLKVGYWLHFWTLRMQETFPEIDFQEVEYSHETWEEKFVPVFDRWVDILEGTFADFA